MAKKVVKKLAKKFMGDANTNAAANTNNVVTDSSKVTTTKIPIKKQQVVASANEQYRKANELDSSGKMKYMRKTGSGPKIILEGDYAASNYKKGGATSKFAKLAPPYNKVTFADKIAGAKKKMGGSTKKK
jgi:hypothetical protein